MKSNRLVKVCMPPLCPVSVSLNYLPLDNRPRGGSLSGPGDPDYDDSGDLFSMYSKMAAAEDLLMAERWQKDADSILVFVSSHISFHTTAYVNKKPIDRSLFCRCCCTTWHNHPGPIGKASRYRQFVSPDDRFS